MAGSGGFAKKSVFTLFAFAIITFVNADTHRLNVPRVLLPVFHDFPVNFTLEVTEGGCYYWPTPTSGVIRIIPTNEQYDQDDRICSSSAIVQATTREASRHTEMISLEDESGKNRFVCNVIVDSIATLNIVTTTRELYIEEAPEAFEVRAYDDQGNEFTSLAGIEFDWTITNTYKQGAHSMNSADNALRFITYDESPYETPTTVAELDKVGKFGHIVLVEGVKTGTAKVSVRLAQPEYSHVPTVEVELIVMANLIIIPVNVTVMQHDSFVYKVMQIHQGRLEEIKLPSSQYYLKAEDENILEIYNDRGSASALEHGRTKVLLHDKNVNDDYDVILPTAEVSVSEVSYITITVMPHRNRALILGQTQEIVMELYDSNGHRFYIGDNVDGEIKLDMQFFDKIMATKNGTHNVVIPRNLGTTYAEATLYGVTDSRGNKIPLPVKLTARAELTIHSQVKVEPRSLALPWDPKAKFRSEVTLKATGGDGTYSWNSRQTSIVTVSQNGVIKTSKAGSADITVSMTQNQYNRDLAKVHVLPPTKLEISQYNMEAAVGERVNLHIALFGKMTEDANFKETAFTDCRNLNFDVYIHGGNFYYDKSDSSQPTVGIACTTLALIAKGVGTAVATVVYSANGHDLVDNVTITAYEPLAVVYPSESQTILAVGSSRKIVFKGGPHPWPGNLQGYHRKVSSEHENIVQVNEHKLAESPDKASIFEVICRALGESVVSFKISNLPILPNCNEKDAVAKVRVICAKPRYISLQPKFKDPVNCPISQNSGRMVAHRGKILELGVVVKDEDGKSFDNFTSLNIEWNVKPNGVVQVPVGVLERTFEDFQVELPQSHYQKLHPSGYVDSLQLRGKVTGYQSSISKLKITPEWPPFPVENEKGLPTTPLIETLIDITFVEDTIITPNVLKVLNNSNNKYDLMISQGSGFVELELDNTEVADVKFKLFEPTKTVTVTPKKPGVLNLNIIDLCLDSPPATAFIEVQQLASIAVDALTKVEIGNRIKISVQLYDTNGYIIALPSPKSVDIVSKLDTDIAMIEPIDEEERQENMYTDLQFWIYGIKEGETHLVFTSSDPSLESEPVIIQVFQPLKVVPKNLTALVGTSYQIHTAGGPKNAEIEFSANDVNSQVVDINSSGILEGKAVGMTKVTAKAVGYDMRGNKVVYSQDNALVNVIELDGVKVVAPTTRIKVGATIPLWVFGTPNNLSPLLIGSMKKSMIFSWSTDHPEILELKNMYDGTGIKTRNHNEVSMRAKALKPGLAKVLLTMTIPCQGYYVGCSNEKTFSSSIKIDVFEQLKLTLEDDSPSMPHILMAPNSILKLSTNFDKQGGMTSYQTLFSGSHDEYNSSSSFIKSVTVDKDGVAKSGDVVGKTVVSITYIETYGFKQSINVVVEVKPVHYMMFNLKTEIQLKSGEELTMLPKGMELKYATEFYDSVGSKFHAANMSANAIYNREDLIRLSNEEKNIVSVKFIQDGDLVVKIYSEKHPTIFDYAHMMIGDVLFPTKTYITVGDIVCFSMPLLSSDGNPGYWKSSSPEVLSIDPVTGIGKAHGPGETAIEQSLMSYLQRELEVKVDPISMISLVLSRDKNVTGMEVFSVPLVLKGKDENIKENNVLSRGLGGCRTVTSFSLDSFPFTCVIQFASRTANILIKDLFLAKPRFDIVSGFYFCDIIPIGSPNSISSVLETRIKITAVSENIASNSIEVAYVPPVFIATKEVTFLSSPENTASTAVLVIQGLPQVLEQLKIETPEEISVGEPEYTKNLVRYRLNLLKQRDEIQGQKIIITSDMTKQNVSLFFLSVLEHSNCANLSFIPGLDHLYLYRYTIGTLVVITLSIIYYFKTKFGCIDMQVGNHSIFANRSFLENCPPPMKQSPLPTTPLSNFNTSMGSTRSSPTSPVKPFSTFEPVYGDPRGFYTPDARRNRSFQS